MSEGIVKWFSSQKGFGFIEQENGEDLFVHKNEVEEEYLEEGDRVKFIVIQGRKGPCASQVSIR